ncbi:DUF2145 domain-containing protein [Ralstonia solanacearum]|uniref:DUF2145 domain-containing protein n=1 Tax=Ralstonia solanacearum TaxID=305 RepID=UPI00399D7528
MRSARAIRIAISGSPNCSPWRGAIWAKAAITATVICANAQQRWLRQAHYARQPVDIDSHALMFASTFVPLVHLDDHPEEDVFAMKLKISLPSTLESFIQERLPDSERVEFCYDSKRVVVHRGWTPIAEGCVPGDEDRVVPLS